MQAETRIPFCVPTTAEVRLLLRTSRCRALTLALRLMYFCGLRLGDVVTLRPGDVLSELRMLFLRAGKGDKDRYVLVDPGTLELLEQRIAEVGWNGTVLLETDSGLIKKIHELCLSCGLYQKYQALGERLSGHSFRHAFATHRYERGLSFETVRDLLGHELADETVLYTARSRHHIRGAYDRCNPFARLERGKRAGDEPPAVTSPYPSELERNEEFASQPQAARPHGLPAFPTADEIEKLLLVAQSQPAMCLLWRLLFASGAWASWWLSLRPENLHWEQGMIEGNGREVHLDPGSWQLLKAWSAAERLFSLELDHVSEFFQECASKTGLARRFSSMGRPLTVDCLRFAFGVHCAGRNMDLVSLMTLLHHRFYDTTRSYLLSAAHRFLPAFDATTPVEAEP